MMIALMAVGFAAQAQTKFHDVELNEAQGPVKSIKQSLMGRDQNVTFTEDGKMQQEGMTDQKYDADGYMQSSKMNAQGMDVEVTYKWENGRMVCQSMNIMGQSTSVKHKYNEKGVVVETSMDLGGQEMKVVYSDIKYDDHGNWISRKSVVMGQNMEQTRTIEYY